MNRHLLLTSSSFSHKKIQDFFTSLVKKYNYKTATIITTANPKKEKALLAQKTKEQILSFGCKDVCFLDIEGKTNLDIQSDIVYVCGGNTFALLKYAKESGLLEQIQKLFDRGGLYMGSSAGSLILSPDIESAAEINPDKNKVGISDLSAFSIVDFAFVPHYRESMDGKIKSFKQRTKKKVCAFVDGSGIYIKDDKTKTL